MNTSASIDRALVALLLAVLLAACSSAPPPRQAAALELATSAGREGGRAMRNGDFNAARALFQQELRLQRSLDNLPGIAMAAINLSTAEHRLGHDDEALRLLDDIAGDALVPYPAELRVAANFRKAVILFDAGKPEAASAALDAVTRGCGRSCSLKAGVYNLRARMALARKDYAAVLDHAGAAADAASDQPEELANAKRLSATAEAALGRHDRALEHYLAALELDKQQGRSARIADDLEGAAGAASQLGRKDEAAGYARRAAAARGTSAPRTASSQ